MNHRVIPGGLRCHIGLNTTARRSITGHKAQSGLQLPWNVGKMQYEEPQTVAALEAIF
jgi:hypothetical protein